MNPPRITIVTPSYNQATYLPETIESILNQGYPNLEYIIIDGGSTDGSVEIIKKYERHLAYWVSEQDSGQSEAINKGLRESTGELFNWINSDDILFPGALQRVADAYSRYPEADLFVGDHACCDANGHIIWVSAVPSSSAISPKNWVLGEGQQSTFISSRALKRVGGVRQDFHMSMDMELYYRVYKSGGRRVCIRGILGAIRKHQDAKGATRQNLWRQEQMRFLREHGISMRAHKTAYLRKRLLRLFDGSYIRMLFFLYRWKGRDPWGRQTLGDPDGQA